MTAHPTPSAGFKLLSDYPPLKDGKPSIMEADDWSLHVSVSMVVGSKSVQVTGWQDDMNCAWEVIREVSSWMFSSRKAFFDNLKNEMRTEDGKHLLAWPECMMFIKPSHLYRAFLLTIASYQAANGVGLEREADRED